jgi:hypothetical protein
MYVRETPVGEDRGEEFGFGECFEKDKTRPGLVTSSLVARDIMSRSKLKLIVSHRVVFLLLFFPSVLYSSSSSHSCSSGSVSSPSNRLFPGPCRQITQYRLSVLPSWRYPSTSNHTLTSNLASETSNPTHTHSDPLQRRCKRSTVDSPSSTRPRRP